MIHPKSKLETCINTWTVTLTYSILDHLCLVNASVFQTLHLCLKGILSLKICSLPAKKTMTTSSVVFFLTLESSFQGHRRHYIIIRMTTTITRLGKLSCPAHDE